MKFSFALGYMKKIEAVPGGGGKLLPLILALFPFYQNIIISVLNFGAKNYLPL